MHHFCEGRSSIHSHWYTVGREEKYVLEKVGAVRKELVIVNYIKLNYKLYSRRLAFERLEGIEGQCGDFNGHSMLLERS